MNTPNDILQYVLEQEYEFEFLTSITAHVNNYSIGEITDKELVYEAGKCRLISKNYKLDIPVTDDDIVTAVINKLYVSAFISRHDQEYQVHFLMHQYPESMKAKFEEPIAREVINYMILKTIVALRLDTFEKVDKYIGK